MTNWMRLALPLCLGVAAAGLNWLTIATKITPRSFVKVSEALEKGDHFTADNLATVELSGDLGTLWETAIAWDDRAILYGRPVPRSLKQGDIVFQRDFVPQRLAPQAGELAVQIGIRDTPVVPSLIFAGDELGFLVGSDLPSGQEIAGSPTRVASGDQPSIDPSHSPELDYLGPFRVLAVGADTVPTGEASRRRTESQILTIAMHRKPGARELDTPSARLVLAAERRGMERIVAIVFHQENDVKHVPDYVDAAALLE